MKIKNLSLHNFKSNFYQFLLLFLAAILPVNNIIINYLTNILGWTPLISIWKEVGIVLLIILLISNFNKLKMVNWLIIASMSVMVFIAIYSSYINGISLTRFILGFRFEILWIILLTSIFTSKKLNIKNIDFAILFGFILTAVFQLFTVVFGNEKVYRFFGFINGWGLNSNKIIEGVQTFNTPYCHSTDGGLIDCRFTGGFPSANNYAAYLILVIVFFVYKIPSVQSYTKVGYILASVAALTLLFFTYSRFAYLGLIVILLMYIVSSMKNMKQWIKKSLLTVFLLLPLLLTIGLNEISIIPTLGKLLPQSIVKVGSTTAHINLTSIAVEIIYNNGSDLILSGYGLSETGPAAKAEYQNPFLSRFVIENTKIAEKYGVPEYLMSVPENWYLQLILNGGWVYFIIYFGIVLYAIVDIYKPFNHSHVLLYGLIAIIGANLFLHVWESVVVSFYFALIYLVYKHNNQFQNTYE